ncbi:hypothetical protein F4776DRAFT_666643 [Hypoxylon sp. NC0597]|nr:hypothetical protein F4776DRAFT_666643 [Hypoxylon sp. NC0597]
MAQREMMHKGLAQVFTGLGIMLGAGGISNSTHQKIIALINADQGFVNSTDDNGDVDETLNWCHAPGYEPPYSAGPYGFSDIHGVGSGFANLSIGDRSPRSVARPASRKSTAGRSSTAYRNVNSNPEPTICPWWSTEGSCRDLEEGRCALYHGDIPNGVKEPKSESTRRFAHYPARRQSVASIPSKKKSKKPSTSSGKGSTYSPTPTEVMYNNIYWGTSSNSHYDAQW